MKIDGRNPNAEALANQRLEQLRSDRSTSSDRTTATSGDRVDLSSEAQLVASVYRAAQNASPIRQDAVERAQRKLASGELGADTLRLADRMIDHLLGR
jgi:flagellar biosynthesis anti-sigma factor FlgM